MKQELLLSGFHDEEINRAGKKLTQDHTAIK